LFKISGLLGFWIDDASVYFGMLTEGSLFISRLVFALFSFGCEY